MGNGDNRRSRKMLQRKAWRRKKVRLQKQIALGTKVVSKK